MQEIDNAQEIDTVRESVLSEWVRVQGQCQLSIGNVVLGISEKLRV